MGAGVMVVTVVTADLTWGEAERSPLLQLLVASMAPVTVTVSCFCLFLFFNLLQLVNWEGNIPVLLSKAPTPSSE